VAALRHPPIIKLSDGWEGWRPRRAAPNGRPTVVVYRPVFAGETPPIERIKQQAQSSKLQ